MRVIGADPSLTATGVAAVDFSTNRVLAWTVLKSKTDSANGKIDDTARRVVELGSGFRSFVAPYLPAIFCVEGQVGAMFGGKQGSMATTFKVGVAYGAILASCSTQPLVINPSEVRRRLRGKRDVSKEDIRRYCKAHFGSRHPEEPRSKADREAVWDAVAVVLAMESEIERLAALIGGT